MANTLLSAKIPSVMELCCVVAQIDVAEIKDASAKSHFHWKTMKCRLIIHELQDHVIASPAYETITSIHVITSVNFYNGGTLQNSLRNMNVTWSAPRPVTPDIYAKCLRYSVEFAIAPRWNRVGPYLISDQHFLTFPGSFAIRFGLTVQAGQDKNAQSIMKVEPLKVHMIEVKLEDLKIPPEIIAHFMADPSGVIDTASLGTFRVTVLPSLKRGRLMAVVKRIPASSPFKNYAELRRHWKNMYGYRLPHRDDDLTYCEILFPVPTAERFVYPDICVRSQVSDRPYLGDSEMAIRSFARDLNETVPRVCDQIFKITRNACPFENSSSLTFFPEKNEPGSAQTPDHRGVLDTSARLSFFRAANRICSQTSTLMSPTPSLRGSARAQRGGCRSRRILTSRGTIAEAKIRVTDRPRDSQNCCPNSDNSSGREVSGNTEKKIVPVKFSCSNDSFRTPAEPVTDGDSFLTESSEDDSSSSGRRTAKIRKTTISAETRSKYFAAVEEGDKESDENLISPRAGASTLSQKLKRNLSSVKK